MNTSTDYFRELFEMISTCLALYRVVDNGQNFVFLDFNPAAEKVEKISKSEVLGKKVTDVFPGVVEFGLLDVFKRVW
ncbi:MAG: histidine kinase, partial [Caldithrix sp.]|nr:histidine kinase [Caldithrix sp.]